MKSDFEFNLQITNIIKGIALILMFALHLFVFPEWLTDGNYFISIPLFSETFAYYFGDFGGICVCIFMFLTGYGMYFSYQKGKCIRHSLGKIIVFLLKYWTILFTFFLPIQLILGRRYFDSSKWFLELFGVYTSLVGFAWYVRFYVLCLLTLPILKNLIGKNVFLSFCVAVIPFYIPCVYMRYLSNYMHFNNALSVTEEYLRYMPVVLVGYCFAKFKLFCKICLSLKKAHADSIILYILGCVLIFILRINFQFKGEIYIPAIDIIYVPFFVFFVIGIINKLQFKVLESILELIGKNSMNLWFLQSIFFFKTNALQWIVYLPKWSFAVLTWNIVLLLPVSVFYNKIFMLNFRHNLLEKDVTI